MIVYHKTREDAEKSARSQSQLVPCALWVRTNELGYYVSTVGRVGDNYFIRGVRDDEMTDAKGDEPCN